MTESEPDAVRLRAEIRRARVGAAAAALTDTVRVAWTGAAARRVVVAAVDTVRAASLAERVRAIGIWATTAALTDAVLTPLDPGPVTISRWALWAGVLVLGATAAAFAEPVTAAWIERRGNWLR